MAWGSNKSIIFGIIILSIFGSTQSAFAAPHILSNGPGDGSVSVGVNGYGGFGFTNGLDASDATFDPIGPVIPADTTFASAIAIKTSTETTRTFLTTGIGTIFGSPFSELLNPPVAGDLTSAISSFSIKGLDFNLVQFLTFTSSGTTLTQTYTITNPDIPTIPPIPPIIFELVRYMDGDLKFIPSVIEGGGQFFDGDGTEILFETDVAEATKLIPTTFVGIISEGGTIPVTNRYEINVFSTLGPAIVSGASLNDIVFGDSNADDFIDPIFYDVSIALRNEFSLGAGESVVYVTKTVFGNGAPQDVEVDPPTEEMVGGMIFPIDTMALLIVGAQSITWIIPVSLSIIGIGLVLVKRRIH
jgi:hypothetical protein